MVLRLQDVMVESGKFDFSLCQQLGDITRTPLYDCWQALCACKGDMNDALVFLIERRELTRERDLETFRDAWIAEIDTRSVQCSGRNLGHVPSKDTVALLDLESSSSCGRTRIPRISIAMMFRCQLLHHSDLMALCVCSVEVNQLWLDCLHVFSGTALPAGSPFLRRAAHSLSARGIPFAMSSRQLHPNCSGSGVGLVPTSLFQACTVNESLLSLDIDAWTVLEMISVLPLLVSLRFLRVFHLVGRSKSKQPISWPPGLQKGAAAVPGQVLLHTSGRPPKRLLLYLRSYEDVAASSLQVLHSALHHETATEELHLVDTATKGCTTLRGLFGKAGPLYEAPLRRLLYFRHRTAAPFEGFLSAVRVALPNLEEVYVSYSSKKCPETARSELVALLSARASTLRRFAVGGEACAGVCIRNLAMSLPGLTVDLRLGLSRKYNFNLSCPEGVADWSWTWFGAGSPLCPSLNAGSKQPLLDADSFIVLPR